MELLNPSPAPILPRTMWVLYRALMSTPGLTRRELTEAVCPSSMRDETPSNGAHVNRALDALIRYELVTIDENSDAETQTLTAAEDTSSQAFVRHVRWRMLTASEGVEPPPEDLRRGAAWLLTQPPQKRLDQRTADHEVPGLFINDTRWNTFTYWATFLGLGREWPLEPGGLTADPTHAVADVIRSSSGLPVGEDGMAIELESLVQRVETELPLIAGERFGAEHDVSHALAHALRSLGSQGLLFFERRSDARSVVRFPPLPGSTEEMYSHVLIRMDV